MTEKVRTLVFAWTALMALSLILARVGDVIHPTRLGQAMIVAVVAAAALKAHLVLRFYLGLKAAPGALKGFTSAVVVVLTLVAASFLLFATSQTPTAKDSSRLTFVKEGGGAEP